MRYTSKHIKIDDQHVGNMKGMFLTSGDGEDYPETRFVIYGFGHSFKWFVPRFIKPFEYEHTFVATWKEGKPTQSYPIFLEKKYGWTYLDNFLQIHYGIHNDNWEASNKKGLNSKCWSYFLPWMEWKFDNHKIFDGNNVIVQNNGQHIDYEIIENEIPKLRFKFEDTDGEILYADCYVESRTWTRGIKWFSWLKYIYKNRVNKDLNIAFSSETGAKKGTYKGGTVDTSIKLEYPDEPPIDAFKRYCTEHKMVFIEEIEFLGGQKIINIEEGQEDKL